MFLCDINQSSRLHVWLPCKLLLWSWLKFSHRWLFFAIEFPVLTSTALETIFLELFLELAILVLIFFTLFSSCTGTLFSVRMHAMQTQTAFIKRFVKLLIVCSSVAVELHVGGKSWYSSGSVIWTLECSILPLTSILTPFNFCTRLSRCLWSILYTKKTSLAAAIWPHLIVRAATIEYRFVTKPPFPSFTFDSPFNGCTNESTPLVKMTWQ